MRGRKYLGRSGGRAERGGMFRRRPGDSVIRLKSARILDGWSLGGIDIRQPLAVEVEYWQLESGASAFRPNTILRFMNEDGTELFASGDFNNKESDADRPLSGDRSNNVLDSWRLSRRGASFRDGASLEFQAHCGRVSSVVAFLVVDRSTGDGVKTAVQLAGSRASNPHLDMRMSARATTHQGIDRSNSAISTWSCVIGTTRGYDRGGWVPSATNRELRSTLAEHQVRDSMTCLSRDWWLPTPTVPERRRTTSWTRCGAAGPR